MYKLSVKEQLENLKKEIEQSFKKHFSRKLSSQKTSQRNATEVRSVDKRERFPASVSQQNRLPWTWGNACLRPCQFCRSDRHESEAQAVVFSSALTRTHKGPRQGEADRWRQTQRVPKETWPNNSLFLNWTNRRTMSNRRRLLSKEQKIVFGDFETTNWKIKCRRKTCFAKQCWRWLNSWKECSNRCQPNCLPAMSFWDLRIRNRYWKRCCFDAFKCRFHSQTASSTNKQSTEITFWKHSLTFRWWAFHWTIAVRTFSPLQQSVVWIELLKLNSVNSPRYKMTVLTSVCRTLERPLNSHFRHSALLFGWHISLHSESRCDSKCWLFRTEYRAILSDLLKVSWTLLPWSVWTVMSSQCLKAQTSL